MASSARIYAPFERKVLVSIEISSNALTSGTSPPGPLSTRWFRGGQGEEKLRSTLTILKSDKMVS
jgi:hypothetical protein